MSTMRNTNADREPVREREQLRGICDRCDQAFPYYLIHSGFNDSYYAYCDLCGKTAILDSYSPSLSQPRLQRVSLGRIPAELEGKLCPCECGGRFVVNAGPRCPHCGSSYPQRRRPRLLSDRRKGQRSDGAGKETGKGYTASWLKIAPSETISFSFRRRNLLLGRLWRD